MAEGRVFLLTINGYVGLASSSIKPGVQACVILGCQVLLFLRPNDTRVTVWWVNATLTGCWKARLYYLATGGVCFITPQNWIRAMMPS